MSILTEIVKCICIKAKCVNLLSAENDFTAGAADTSNHKQSPINFSNSLNKLLFLGFIVDANSATFGTEVKESFLVVQSPITSAPP